MRVALCATAVGLFCAIVVHALQPAEPFVPIGVWYAGGTSRAPMVSRNPAPEKEVWRRDLAAIRSLGFNSIKTWVDWASSEPERGRYRFDALEQLLTLADESGLRVIVKIYTDAAPAWRGSYLVGCCAGIVWQALTGLEFRPRSGVANQLAGIPRLLPRPRRCPVG